MNRITKITRQEIASLFKDGINVNCGWNNKEIVFYPYYGVTNEIDFLKKMFPLDEMPSNDPRFKNATEDIIQHRINNEDYEDDWIFKDERFGLLNCRDEVFLDFLALIFHPENLNEKLDWNVCFLNIIRLLQIDGYEMYISKRISNKSVYKWRVLSDIEISTGNFAPFSERNKSGIKDKIIKFSLSLTFRDKLIQLFNKYNTEIYRRDDTNWGYSVYPKNVIIYDLHKFYKTRAYNDKGEFTETDDIEHFINKTTPYYVFDAIEIFDRNFDDLAFFNEINTLLSDSKIPYKLIDGKITSSKPIIKTNITTIREVGLKELLEQAQRYYNKAENIETKQIALEKLWDAFERLKTYYKDKGKSESSNQIIADMANNNSVYIKLFTDEFQKLTEIGNSYRIRHHETNRIEIPDSNYYDYLFKRCLALIELALKYIKIKSI